VRNLADGDVEAFVQGDEHAVAGMLDWLREGPPPATVWRCTVDDAEPDPSPAGFEIRR
jgi:acylphosphatase